MTPFQKPLHPEDVGELIDLTVPDHPDTKSMAQMQLEGVAALYNTLCEHPFAYLADDVGMGKTYQALALAAVVWHEKPTARILFIVPDKNLQDKWRNDYKRFFTANYRRAQRSGDDRATSILFNEPVHRPQIFENLRSWTPHLNKPQPIAAFLRMSSFTRPIYITSPDPNNLDALWQNTKKEFDDCGLTAADKPEALSAANASYELNIAFARALNATLKSLSADHPYFDLVIVDEAQNLRNTDNQTNTVLFKSLRGHVGKWLFMSATPAHRGPADIPTIVNHYPNAGEILAPNLTKNLPAMQEELQKFMIRRQREYLTGTDQTKVRKQEYRKHDQHGWSVSDTEMTVLGTLSMGLVQKGLVNVLQAQNNRYRIGFLSSFESLQSSLFNKPPSPEHTAKTDNDTEDDNENTTDWHHTQSHGPREPDAPDMAFIHQLNADFENKFGMPLEHPKLDSAVDRVATQAFGTDKTPGGHKFLIFTRRISTVATLRDRLMARYIQSIEARVQRCWNVELDWSGPNTAQEIVQEIVEEIETEIDQNDPETFEYDPSADPFRKAMANKGWLFRYRQTFRASGRNALFFEDDWIGRLCLAGGVDPTDAANKLPDEIWAESWTHASKPAGKTQQQHPASRLRYIAVQAILRCPHIFNMNENQAAPWKKAYQIILHNHLERSNPADTPHRAPALFTTKTLWTHWDEQFNNGPLALPTANPATTCQTTGQDELYKRQVARTILAQNLRLNDTIIDLYYADEATPENKPAQQSGKDFAPAFLHWLEHDDPSAQQLRQDCANWLEHLRLIVDSSLDGAGRSWSELAKNETWRQLYNAAAAVGITGGSGARSTALAQFRTPSLPRVIVCTDTLKEGVDLHLFCDHVLHYGVAWTPGDLEQRVGRVDRYFSQIERRLSQQGAPPHVQLQIGYPHITSSLERAQVERVIARQRIAEQLMDSPIASSGNDTNELIIGASAPRHEKSQMKAFLLREFSHKRRPIVAVSAADAHAIAAHYKHWFAMLLSALKTHGWTMTPPLNNDELPKNTKLDRDSQHLELTWSFDGAARRYVLEVSRPQSAHAKKTKNKKPQNTIIARLPVPTPEDTPKTRTHKQTLKALLTALEPQEDTLPTI